MKDRRLNISFKMILIYLNLKNMTLMNKFNQILSSEENWILKIHFKEILATKGIPQKRALAIKLHLQKISILKL